MAAQFEQDCKCLSKSHLILFIDSPSFKYIIIQYLTQLNSDLIMVHENRLLSEMRSLQPRNKHQGY